MFYLVNTDGAQNDPMDLTIKRRALKCLIRCINFNQNQMRVIRNCLLTMSKFQIPGTVSEHQQKNEILNWSFFKLTQNLCIAALLGY